MTVSLPQGYLVAFVATVTLLFLFRPLAVRIGLVDVPDTRKQHDGRIPLIGGIAMFCGFLFAVLTVNVPIGPLRGLFFP